VAQPPGGHLGPAGIGSVAVEAVAAALLPIVGDRSFGAVGAVIGFGLGVGRTSATRP
jgi:hypothetical protein